MRSNFDNCDHGQVRKEFPDVTIMAGNVVTGEMVEELILSGADLIKVLLDLIKFFAIRTASC